MSRACPTCGHVETADDVLARLPADPAAAEHLRVLSDAIGDDAHAIDFNERSA